MKQYGLGQPVRRTRIDAFSPVAGIISATSCGRCAARCMAASPRGSARRCSSASPTTDTGQLLSGNLTDYAIPHADTLPSLEFSYNVVPCRTNPLGVKGAGDAGAIGAPPALLNAVIDAVAGLGIETLDKPLTPERLWQALRNAALKEAASA